MFDSAGFKIFSPEGEVVLMGSKRPEDKVWPVTVPNMGADPVLHTTTDVVRHQMNADFVAFAHAAMGNPTYATFLTAVRRGYLRTWPDLTVRRIQHDPPRTVATAAGHLDLIRQDTGKSKSDRHPLPAMAAASVDTTPTSWISEVTDVPVGEEISVLDDGMAYTWMVPIDPIMHADLTGKFGYPSRQGNNYVLVAVYNNYVKPILLKNREAAESYLRAYQELHEFFTAVGSVPTIVRTDNESSKLVTDYFKRSRVQVQYVPPNNHRANKAERPIRDFKNHFVASFASVNAKFPLSLWDEVLPQVELTIDLLRPFFGPDPSISAYEGIHGNTYDFVQHPIAPVGTLVYIHNRNRESWAPHGEPGFYLGPSPLHYKTFRVYALKSRAIRDTDSVACVS
jgi:hypothetical protein